MAASGDRVCRRVLPPALAALLVVLATACVRESDAPGVWAVVGATVVPMDSERVLPDHTVVVRDGRIEAFGPSTEVRPPADATTIDGAGRFLLPGLFDTHVHLNEEERDEHLLLYLAAGVTTVQSMHGSPRHLELRRRVTSGELLGPRILTTGPTTATERVSTPERAAALARRQREAGYDAIKQYGDGADSMTRETYARLIEAAHEEGLRVVGHAPRNMPFSVVLEEGQDSIDHMEEIVYTYEPIKAALGPLFDLQFGRVAPEDVGDALRNLPDLRPALAPAVETLSRRAREAGLAVTPTLVAFETIWRQTTPEYPRLLEAAEMRYVSPLTRLDWGPERNSYRRGWSDRLEAMDKILGRSLELQKAIVKGFQDAGVPILVGTDAPLTFVYPGFAVHRELALLVDSGLSPYEALVAATAAPARELGLADEVGTIERGKRADLVLLEENPLEDVSRIEGIAGVMAAGRWLPREELDRLVESHAAFYDAAQAAISPMLPSYDQLDASGLMATYREIEDPGPEVDAAVERLVNDVGYALLNDEGDPGAAVEALQLNADAFPDSPNVWDSLGEAQLSARELAASADSYRRCLELDPDNDSAQRGAEWVAELRAIRQRPLRLEEAELRPFAGDYGPRHVVLRDGALRYRRGEGTERRLEPLGEDRFALDGLGWFRLRFERDAGGRPVRIVGMYLDGRTDESLRDGS